MFDVYRIPPKKSKCNACVLCTKLHEYLTSNTVNQRCLLAFNSSGLTPNMKSICSKIYMDLLGKIVEASRLRSCSTEAQVIQDETLTLTKLNTLSYIAGATLHKICLDLKDSVSRKMVSKVHQAKVEYRSLQLSKRLILPEGVEMQAVHNPEKLHEIARKQNARKGLKIISDDTFEFFKVLYNKVKVMQTYKELQRNPINL